VLLNDIDKILDQSLNMGTWLCKKTTLILSTVFIGIRGPSSCNPFLLHA
jgi:hypothetical protein